MLKPIALAYQVNTQTHSIPIMEVKKYNNNSWVSAKLKVGESSIHGLGVFTTEEISEGEIVIIWGGQVVSTEEFRQGIGQKHTNVGISENLYLVANSAEEKSVDDYMNHSCNANLWLNDEVTLSAKRNIKAGEELFIDYAIELIDESYVMKNDCYCRNVNCRKTITGRDWRIKEVQQLYQGHFSPFVNERIKNCK